MYKEAFEELDQQGCRDIDDIKVALQKKTLNQHALRMSFYSALEDVSNLETHGGVLLASDASKWPISSTDALKKAAIFGEKNLIETPAIWYSEEEDGYIEGHQHDDPNFVNLEIWEALLKFRPLIKYGLAVILPESIVYAEIHGAAGSHKERKLPEGATRLEFDSPLLRRMFFRERSDANSSVYMLRVEPIMTAAEVLTLETLVDLRLEYTEEYLRFQHLLRTRLENTLLNSDRAFIETIQDLTDVVRQLEARNRLAARKRSVEGVKLLSGIVGVGACLLLDGETAKLVGSLLGATSLKQAVDYLGIRLYSLDNMREDPGFFPWMLHARVSGSL